MDEIFTFCELLEIGNENNIQVDDFDTIFLKGISLQNGIRDAIQQIETNSEQYLSIRYKKNGKQFTLKSFGKISKLDKKEIYYILKFILLIKILKQLNSVIDLSIDVGFLDEEISNS